MLSVKPEYLNRAQQVIKANDFVMLSKTWCKDCKYTYSVWDEYNVKDKIHIIELDLFPDQDEATNLENAFVKIAGKKWVPTIFFKGERFDEQDLKDWKQQGILEEKFKKYGLL